VFRAKRTGGKELTPGDVSYWIQRGATLQTQRLLCQLTGPFAILTAAQAIGTLIAIPFIVGFRATLDQLNFNVTVAGGAGSVARVGIYRSTSRVNVYPSSLVVDAGQVDTNAIGYKANAAVATLRPGLYWAAYLAGVAAPTVHIVANSAANPHASPLLGWTAANPPVANGSLRVAQAYGALPDPFPAGAALNSGPSTAIFGRFSA
jgi:hypothetical protein